MGPWDPSNSIPGEKLTYLQVKTTILAQKLWILEFFWKGQQKKLGTPGAPWGQIIFHAFLGKVNKYGGNRFNLF